MAAKVEVDVLLGVHTEELSNYLHDEDLRVGKLWSKTTLADAAPFEPAVHEEAEDGDDEDAKIREDLLCAAAVGLVATERAGRSSLWFKPLGKRTDRVS